jgi:endo-1,4-beta-D-glucanase Y
MRRAGRFAAVLAGVCIALGFSLKTAPGQVTAQSRPDPDRLWEAYAGRFISGDGRVVDPMRGDLTTSEGQSYALFFALVNNDRTRFDMLFKWTSANLAAGDLGTHLPAWEWGKGKDGHWGVLDVNSAADSDLWIAYDLVEAGRLWNDPHYAALGRRLAALIARRETVNLPKFGPVLLPAPVGFKFPTFWVLNPAYSPVFIFDRLAVVDPADSWAQIAAQVPPMLEQSARGGFAMDWVCYGPHEDFTPCQANGTKTPPPVGAYEAIRVYLWAGMLSSASPAKARILKALPGMNAYLQHSSVPPEKISADGTVLPQPGPIGFSAALLPYLQSFSDQAAVAQQMVRLKSQLDEKSNLYGSTPTYYDQNLALFGSGWIEKRFQFGSSGELLVRWSR